MHTLEIQQGPCHSVTLEWRIPLMCACLHGCPDLFFFEGLMGQLTWTSQPDAKLPLHMRHAELGLFCVARGISHVRGYCGRCGATQPRCGYLVGPICAAQCSAWLRPAHEGPRRERALTWTGRSLLPQAPLYALQYPQRHILCLRTTHFAVCPQSLMAAATLPRLGRRWIAPLRLCRQVDKCADRSAAGVVRRAHLWPRVRKGVGDADVDPI